MKRFGWTLLIAGSAAVAVAPLVLPAGRAAAEDPTDDKTIVVPAVSFSAQGGGEASRVESLRRPGPEYVHFWHTPGHYLEWTFDCPKAEDYAVALRCVAKLPAKRSLSVNGSPVAGLESFTVQPTSKGHWRDGWAQWSDVALPAPVKLAQGRNTLRMTCLDDVSIRLSEIALTAQDGTALKIPAARFSAESGGHVQVISPPVLGSVGSEWRKAWHEAGHWVQWDVEVPAAGRYAMGLHYRADGYCRLELQVNGRKVAGLADFIPPKTGDLDAYTKGTLPTPIMLKQGKNTVRITTLGQWARDEVIFDGMFALSAFDLTPLADDALPGGDLLPLTTMDRILASVPKHEEKISPALLGPALPKTEGAIALKAGTRFRLADRQAIVVNADVLPYVENEFSKDTFWDPYDDPKLKALRETYKLDEVVAPGRSEFEKQRLLMRWIWDQWDFGHAQELYNLKDPQWILRETRDEHVFQCMHSGSVMMSAMASMGWVCRRNGSSNHTWNEVWSNEYGKWIMMDATHNIWHERNGTPLSSFEFYHARYVEQTDQVVTHARDDAIWRLKPKKSSFRMSISGGNTYVNGQMPARSARFVIAEGADNSFDPKDLYYPINQAAMALVPDGDALKVALGTMTPNFREFQVRTDGGPWTASDETFTWPLHKGANRLEARSVNKFGVAGWASTVALNVADSGAADATSDREPLLRSIDDPLPPIKSVEIGSRGQFIVNGKLFIPFEVWLQDPVHFPKLKAAGMNTCAGYWWSDAEKKGQGGTKSMDEYAAMVRKAGFYFVPPYMPSQMDATKKVARMDNVLAWTQNDEPDLPVKVTDPATGKTTWRPRDTLEETARCYRDIKALGSGRPVMIGFTSHFMSDQNNRYDKAAKERIYPAYARFGDGVGYDTYPIFGYNRPDHLYRVAMGVRELRALVGPGKVIGCAIETNKGSKWVKPENQLDVLPKHTRAEVWMALISGATEILYFTHSWVPEPYTQFAPGPKMIAELHRLNDQITRLTGPLLAEPAEGVAMTLAAEDGAAELACHFKATRYKGDTWIFAQNMDMNPGKDDRGRAAINPRTGRAVFTVDALKAGTPITVVDENRTITAEAGRFTDQFAGLAEHVYRLGH